MKYLLVLILFFDISIVPIFAQEQQNPSLIIDNIEIPAQEFNRVLRDTQAVQLNDIHAYSWQVTVDNNLLYANPNGNAVIRLYDQESDEEFIEMGMGSTPDNKF